MNLTYQLQKDGFTNGKKRKQSTKTILITIFSILSALIVALLVATTLGYDPFDLFVRLFYVGFNDPIALFSNIGVFCFAGFAFAFASRAGLFNIGISGQMLAAGTFIVFLTTKWIPADLIPTGAGQLIILFAGMMVGGLVAMMIGAMDVYLKINSVVSSILLNWIIYFISFFLLATFAAVADGGNVITNSLAIPNEFRLWSTDGTGGIWPITILVVVFAILMFVVFKYTVFGHKIKSVGLSPDAAKYAGYNVNVIRLSSFAISGAIAGVLACILYTTKSAAVIDLNVSVDSVPIEGFNGIAISLIGNNNPFGILLISVLFGLFQNSVPGIVIPASYINVLLGLLMLGSALSIMVLKYKPWQYIKSFRYDINYYKEYQNYENRFDSMISKYKSISHYEKQNIFDQVKEKNKLIAIEIKRLEEAIKKLGSTSGTVEQVNDVKFKINLLKQKKEIILRNADIAWSQTLSNIKEDYQTEKTGLIDAWKTVKIQMLMDKHFTFEKIVDAKETKISNEYDMALTKHISQLRNSERNSETDKTKIIDQSIGKSDELEQTNITEDAKHISKLESSAKNLQDKIDKSIAKSDAWKKKDISKMKTKQSKTLSSFASRNKMLMKISHEINAIHDPVSRKDLCDKVEAFKTYERGQ